MQIKSMALQVLTLCFSIPGIAQKTNFSSESEYLRNNYLHVTESHIDASITVVDTNNVLRTVKISELPVLFKNHKASLLQNFPIMESTTSIARVEQGGGLSFAAAAVSHKNEQYVVTFLYNVYKTETRDSITYKIGYGLRLIATLVTNSSNIDLGNLLKLGFSLNRKKTKGYLHTEVCGLVNSEFGAWVPILLDLSEAGINQCTQTFVTIKAKVSDSATFVLPQILEVKNNKKSATEPLNRALLVNKIQN